MSLDIRNRRLAQKTYRCWDISIRYICAHQTVHVFQSVIRSVESSMSLVCRKSCDNYFPSGGILGKCVKNSFHLQYEYERIRDCVYVILFLRESGIFHMYTWQLRVRKSIRRTRVYCWGERGEVYRGTKGTQEREKLLNDEVPSKCFSGEFEWPTCTS